MNLRLSSYFFGAFFSIAGLTGCQDDGSATEADEETIRYEVTFRSTWSEVTHPLDFPGDPHFSGLIGGTHNVNVNLWQEGEVATPGIEDMAETGGKRLL